MKEFICWLLFVATQIGIMRGLMELEWLVTLAATAVITLICLMIRAGHSPGCCSFDVFD